MTSSPRGARVVLFGAPPSSWASVQQPQDPHSTRPPDTDLDPGSEAMGTHWFSDLDNVHQEGGKRGEEPTAPHGAPPHRRLQPPRLRAARLGALRDLAAHLPPGAAGPDRTSVTPSSPSGPKSPAAQTPVAHHAPWGRPDPPRPGTSAKLACVPESRAQEPRKDHRSFQTKGA